MSYRRGSGVTEMVATAGIEAPEVDDRKRCIAVVPRVNTED